VLCPMGKFHNKHLVHELFWQSTEYTVIQSRELISFPACGKSITICEMRNGNQEKNEIEDRSFK